MVMHSPKEKTPRQMIPDQTFVQLENTVQDIEQQVANNELGAVGGNLTPTQTQLQRTPLTSRIPIFNENGEVITNLNKESAEKKKKALEEKIKKVRIQQQKDEAEELQNKRNEELKKKQINDQRAAEKKAKQEELIKKRKEEEEIKKQKAQDDRNKRIEERRQRQEYFDKCKEERRLDEEREKERQKEEALHKEFKFQQNLIKKHASFDIYQQAKEQETEYLKEIKQQEKGGAIKKVRDERHFQAFNIGFEDIVNEDLDTASQISHNFNESIIDGGLSADENYDDELISKIDMLNIDLKKKNSKGNIIENQRTRYEQIRHEKLEQDRLFAKMEEKDKLKYTQYFDTLEREIQIEVEKYMALINNENWDDIHSYDLKKYIDEAVRYVNYRRFKRNSMGNTSRISVTPNVNKKTPGFVTRIFTNKNYKNADPADVDSQDSEEEQIIIPPSARRITRASRPSIVDSYTGKETGSLIQRIRENRRIAREREENTEQRLKKQTYDELAEILELMDTSNSFEEFYDLLCDNLNVQRDGRRNVLDKDICFYEYTDDTISSFLAYLKKYHRYAIVNFIPQEYKFISVL
ncbi:unnamed protein product, partial [Rotaria magnacalcarata]